MAKRPRMTKGPKLTLLDVEKRKTRLFAEEAKGDWLAAHVANIARALDVSFDAFSTWKAALGNFWRPDFQKREA